jgi:hypothetical protein
MLSIVDPSIGRRGFLRIGTLGLGGTSLARILRARESIEGSKSPFRDRSVIFLFLHGGPSQIETFDPKMDAPSGIRSATGEVPTTVPGLSFGGTFEKLARHAHELSIVRSFQTGDGNHDIKPIVSRGSLGANLGSIYARVAGTTDPATGLPRNVALFPRAIDPEAQPTITDFGRFDSAGPLGASHAPFVPGAGGQLNEDMTLGIPRTRLDDRRTLLSGLDRWQRALDRGDLHGIDRFEAQAFDTILGAARRAFDLSNEDPRVIERYDTSRVIDPATIDKKWNNHKFYADNVRTLGRLLLLARRLCEAGCGFVTVTTSFVWDMHSDVNNAPMTEGMRYCGLPLDHALSAFIEDVESRGLRDRILLVACGEMGRTPRINRGAGRDHWGGLAPLLLYGGGLEMGRVIGESNRDGGEPASAPIRIPNLLSTIWHSIFDVGEVRTLRGLPPDVIRVITDAAPIEEL